MWLECIASDGAETTHRACLLVSLGAAAVIYHMAVCELWLQVQSGGGVVGGMPVGSAPMAGVPAGLGPGC